MSGKVVIRNSIKDGDISEIAHLHETLYSGEYDYNQEFADYVSGILMEFGRQHTDRERFWIVEMDGSIMGCLAVVEHSQDEGRIRWFLVHPELRGRGIGSRMFKEAVEFMKKHGYQKAFLTTQKHLVKAAHIYEKFGFSLVEEKEETCWGHNLVNQRYELRIP